MPGIADNALAKAAPLIERLAAYRPEPRLEAESKALIEAFAGREVEAGEALEVARGLDPFAAELLEPLLVADRLADDDLGLRAAQRDPVRSARSTVDCRLLPGQTQADVEPELRAVLGEGDYDFEWIEGRGGTRSPLDTPLWEAVSGFVAGDRARARPRCRSPAPASRTATGCARRSGRWRTASSRCARWTCSWPRG